MALGRGTAGERGRVMTPTQVGALLVFCCSLLSRIKCCSLHPLTELAVKIMTVIMNPVIINCLSCSRSFYTKHHVPLARNLQMLQIYG